MVQVIMFGQDLGDSLDLIKCVRAAPFFKGSPWGSEPQGQRERDRSLSPLILAVFNPSACSYVQGPWWWVACNAPSRAPSPPVPTKVPRKDSYSLTQGL